MSWTFPTVTVQYPDGRVDRHTCLSHTEAVSTAARLWQELEAECCSVRVETPYEDRR